MRGFQMRFPKMGSEAGVGQREGAANGKAPPKGGQAGPRENARVRETLHTVTYLLHPMCESARNGGGAGRVLTGLSQLWLSSCSLWMYRSNDVASVVTMRRPGWIKSPLPPLSSATSAVSPKAAPLANYEQHRRDWGCEWGVGERARDAGGEEGGGNWEKREVRGQRRTRNTLPVSSAARRAPHTSIWKRFGRLTDLWT